MEENKNTSATIVMVGFLIIGILIGISFFVYFKSKERSITVSKPVDNSYHSITVENKTKDLYTVILPSGENIDVAPDNKIIVSLGVGDFINATAYNHDGTINKYFYNFNNPKVTYLFIGNSGIESNLSSGDVTFVNVSKYPVMFIEKSPNGGKRWGSDIIPPEKETFGNFVYSKSIWQVVHPTDENQPISEINIGYIPKKLVFNGKSLKAI